ncbi:phosphoribosylglycinamide formyltransferase [Porticoccaceae bacterium]|nr:phosphoribosylglycinamide formyltransferase [Porticoccaceae bacterium]
MTVGDQPLSKIVILISGSGSNLQSFIDACSTGIVDGKIMAVISNRPGVKGLDRASAADIPNIVIDHRAFQSREEFDQHLAEVITSFTPDLVVLAGFMRILTDGFVNQFIGKLINIHPSLLPSYPGLNTHQRAIEAGDSTAGATVHFVTPELDGGPAILQAAVSILPKDTAADLAARVLIVEHEIYPVVAQWYCQGRVVMDQGKVFYDGIAVGESGLLFSNESEH